MCVKNSQRLKFILNTNKETVCCGGTMVLGKGLPCEHIGVRHICCRSTMVLGKWFPCEHIGVRHMKWQENWWPNSTLHPWTQARRLEGNREGVMTSISRPRQSWTSGRQDIVWCHWGENFWLEVKRESDLRYSCKSTWELVKELKVEFEKCVIKLSKKLNYDLF